MPKQKGKPVEEDEDVDLEEEDTEDPEVEDEDEDDEDEADEKPAKGKKAKGGKEGKGGKGGNLVPREPVKVPVSLMKAQPKEIRILLKKREELMAAGDKKGLRKLRAQLRKAGFRLSQLLQSDKPAKVADEEDDD